MEPTTKREYGVLLILVLILAVSYGVSFPVLAISLERLGITPGLIGLNAAMPAVGWLLASLALPKLHQKFSVSLLMLGFLAFAIIGWVGFLMSDNFLLWLFWRFLFGGGIGMFLRTSEFWINAHGGKTTRGRMLGGYLIVVMLGISLGSMLQPQLGLLEAQSGNFVLSAVGVTAIFVALLGLRLPLRQENQLSKAPQIGVVYKAAPVAMIGVLVYGYIEDVPAYLLSVYALKVGFADDIAAYTLAAVALGTVVFALPLGWLSDKIGRKPVLLASTCVGLLGAFLIPLLRFEPTLFLSFLFVWGGALGAIYNVSQAMLGDQFEELDLTAANASFGVVYALAAIVGPVVNGLAMQIWEPHGLMLSVAIAFGFLLTAVIWKGSSKHG